jgi:hypothetical protein
MRKANSMSPKKNPSIGEVMASLETQAAFHRERVSFHAEHEAHHRKQRTVHEAELEEILRRLESFRSAAAEAVDFAARPGAAASGPSPQHDDLGSRSRPRVRRMVERVIADKEVDEPFGPLGLTEEVNQRFGQRLRRPVKANQISTALWRLEQKGIIHLVRKGRPHAEALYARQAQVSS